MSGRGRVRSPQTLSGADRRVVAAWAADCAERVLCLFETEAQGDDRPRALIARTRSFARGELTTAKEIRRRFAGGIGPGQVKAPAAAVAARAAGQAAKPAGPAPPAQRLRAGLIVGEEGTELLPRSRVILTAGRPRLPVPLLERRRQAYWMKRFTGAHASRGPRARAEARDRRGRQTVDSNSAVPGRGLLDNLSCMVAGPARQFAPGSHAGTANLTVSLMPAG